MARETGGPHKCRVPNCDKADEGFTERSSEARHFLEVHAEFNPYAIQHCPGNGCNKSFNSRRSWDSHAKIHGNYEQLKSIVKEMLREQWVEHKRRQALAREAAGESGDEDTAVEQSYGEDHGPCGGYGFHSAVASIAAAPVLSFCGSVGGSMAAAYALCLSFGSLFDGGMAGGPAPVSGFGGTLGGGMGALPSLSSSNFSGGGMLPENPYHMGGGGAAQGYGQVQHPESRRGWDAALDTLRSLGYDIDNFGRIGGGIGGGYQGGYPGDGFKEA